jgi:hypothetical protein
MKKLGYFALLLTCIIIALLTMKTSSALSAQSNNNAESRNMQLLGFNDLQSRSAYQPVVQQQGVQYILYVGHHSLGTNPLTGQPLPSFNPLTKVNEPNGTSIVDVSDPRHPVYLAHIPVGTTGNGGAQMVRVCNGSTLPVHITKYTCFGPTLRLPTCPHTKSGIPQTRAIQSRFIPWPAATLSSAT